MKSARISRKKFCNPPSRRVSAFESRSWPPPMTRRAGLRTNSSVFMAQTIHGRILRCCTGSMRTGTKLSILEHPLVRDALAYLRVIASPFDDIACARVLAAPAWHLEAADLVRLAERASKKRGTALYDVLQAPQSELPFDASHSALAELLEFLSNQRKTLKRRTGREILSDLMVWLEVPQRAGTQDRKYVNQLSEFVKDWEPKSETRGLPEFLEYLDYFEQAGGTLSLEDDAPGDAVQLMTVHGAKGLEFLHVFLLRVNQGAFPAKNRSPLFEFPTALMKEA